MLNAVSGTWWLERGDAALIHRLSRGDVTMSSTGKQDARWGTISMRLKTLNDSSNEAIVDGLVPTLTSRCILPTQRAICHGHYLLVTALFDPGLQQNTRFPIQRL